MTGFTRRAFGRFAGLTAAATLAAFGTAAFAEGEKVAVITPYLSQPGTQFYVEAFEARFARGVLPEDLPEVSVAGAPLGIGALLKQAGLAASTSEALRNVEQGGVRIDGNKIEDKGLKVQAGTYVIQVGKRRAARFCVPQPIRAAKSSLMLAAPA